MLAWWHCWYVPWYLLLMLVVMLCFREVCTGDVHASQYTMLNGYDSLLIWWIVCDTVMIMLIACPCIVICIVLIYHGSAYLHSSLTGLNWTWTTVGWVMVPPYRTDQCNHAYLYGKVLTGSIVVPLAGASHEGRLWACVPWPGKQT